MTPAIPDDALRALREVWGYPAFRPGQDEAVAAVLAGRDALAVLPTGGGKSLVYQVSPVARRGLALVVSPLVALMQDQVDALARRGVRAAALHSGLGRRQSDQVWTDAEHGLYRLVYLTPERLQTDLFQARAPRLDVTLLAIDEAHCISEWGHDFRPAYRQIAQARPLVTSADGTPAPVVAVTATATPEVRRDILDQLGLVDPAVVVRGFDRPNLVWSVHHVQDPVGQALDVFRAVPGAGLVYAGTRRATEAVAERLRGEGVSAEPYHAGLDRNTRQATQRRWLDDETRVVAATSAFGMGIDKADVRAVVHTALPPTLEAYYQEAGRAGRDGERAYAALALGPDAEAFPRDLADRGHPTPADVQAVYAAVGSLGQVALGSEPEGPVTLDLGRLAAVAERPVGIVRAAVDRLAADGLWTVVQPRPGDVRVRLPQGRDGLMRAAEVESVAVQAFADALVRRLPPEAGGGATLRLAPLAEALGLPAARLDAGLDYLAARRLLEVSRPEEGLTLAWHHARSRAAPVDVAALDRGRQRAHARLDDVVRYANAVGCRRQHLLAYFGEAAPGRCGRCDVCLGRHRPDVVTPADEPRLRTILDAVDRGDQPAGPDAPRRTRQLADWLVAEGLLRLTDPLAARFELTPAGQRHLAR
ncbi:RecQ family ATP-dependent DNA helicase [Rubrivirga sp.]|uniref:RecQ family ATP-dependent DNA helicase n=1 Tax=Rubrivirga sp. TaxID=1885344 RepID=UPI003B526281